MFKRVLVAFLVVLCGLVPNGGAFTFFARVTNIGTNSWVAYTGSNLGLNPLGSGSVACTPATTGWGTLGDVPPGTTTFTLSGSVAPYSYAIGVSGGTVGVYPAGVTNLSACSQTLPSPGGTVSWVIWVGAKQTNCTFTIGIQNTGNYTAMYKLFHNGVDSAIIVTVPPGCTVNVQEPEANCDPSAWTYRRLDGGLVTLGTTSDVGCGQVTVGANTINANYGTPPTPLNITLNPAQPPVPNTDTGPTPNNTNVNQVDFQGFTLLDGDLKQIDYDIKQGDSNITNALSHLTLSNSTSVNLTNNLTITNGSGTNFDYTGLLTDIRSNTSPMTWFNYASNVIGSYVTGQVSGATLAGSNFGASIQGGWSNAVGSGVFGSNGLPSGSGSDVGATIDIITTHGIIIPTLHFTLAELYLHFPDLPTLFACENLILVWLCYFSVFWACCDWAVKMLSKALNQRQMGGASGGLAGGLVSVPVGLVYAGIVAALIITLPVAMAAAWATMGLSTGASVASVTSSLTTVNNSPVWAMVTVMIPMWQMVLSVFLYGAFRFLVAWPLTMLVRSITLFLVK